MNLASLGVDDTGAHSALTQLRVRASDTKNSSKASGEGVTREAGAGQGHLRLRAPPTLRAFHSCSASTPLSSLLHLGEGRRWQGDPGHKHLPGSLRGC